MRSSVTIANVCVSAYALGVNEGFGPIFGKCERKHAWRSTFVHKSHSINRPHLAGSTGSGCGWGPDLWWGLSLRLCNLRLCKMETGCCIWQLKFGEMVSVYSFHRGLVNRAFANTEPEQKMSGHSKLEKLCINCVQNGFRIVRHITL